MPQKRRSSRGPSLQNRAAGVLLHPTSLPSRHGIGDLGSAAHEFVDWLRAAGQTWWQMLPVHPVGPGDSPYSALSAFAGSPLLISLDRLVDDGLLDRRNAMPVRGLRADRVSYRTVSHYKRVRLRQAFVAFRAAGGRKQRRFERFCDSQAHWLDDYALFSTLRDVHRETSWTNWPSDLSLRHKRALTKAIATLGDEIEYQRFLQYIFDRQWNELRKYARRQGIGLIGDIPIFVAHDSSDVWAHRNLFDLDARGRARTVSGVPPDLFSSTGQRWGHPQYRWARHTATGFAWWLARFRRILEQFDTVRVDHFLGFQRAWAVPGRARTALRGKWIKVPGRALLEKLHEQHGPLEIIAEDLGLLTPQAAALRDHFGFPGMRLLHFAFGGEDGDRYHQPHTYPRNCVAYPGTHDNDTTVGWFRKLARTRGKRNQITPQERILRYLGTSGHQIHWDIIRLVQMSPANTAITPAQDILGLDSTARMNTPATTTKNWRWRLRPNQLTPGLADRLRDLAETYERLLRT